MDGVNDKSTPTDMPRNSWTDMIEAVRERNERGVHLSNREIAAGVPIMGTPGPAVRSADLGRPVSAPVVRIPPPLTPEEIAENTRAAVAAGLIPPQEAEEMGKYGSLEEAIAAGAPVDADAEAVAAGAAVFREPAPPVGARQPVVRQVVVPASTAALPKLPDFKKVQMIDLVRGKAYVDGLEFGLDASEVKMLRKFCVTKAREQIQKSLDAALKELAEATDDGGSEA